MTIEIKAPSFPESIAEGTVLGWHCAPGDHVERDQLLVEIETDKVVMEVVAADAGTLAEIWVAEGERCTSEQRLGRLQQGAVETAAVETAAVAPITASGNGRDVAVRAPQYPESVAEGTLLAWHYHVGDHVERDALLVEIETDKVVLEVCATDAGTLTSVEATAGQQVASEQRLGTLNVGAAMSAAASSADTPLHAHSTDGEWRLAPAARKLVAEHGVDISTLSGSGRGGRILKEDVQRKLQGAASVTRAELPYGEEDEFLPRQDMRVPMSRLRQTIADRLVRAQQTAAMLTTYNEVDMSAIRQLRAQYQEPFQKAHGVKLGFMSFFVKACTEALKRFPDVNASIDGDDIVYHGYHDIGVAVSTERGLVVPVLRDTDTLQLAEIEHQIADFGQRGRENRLTLDEMTGGTFTITNGGVFGSLLSTPILNPPQTAILGMHKIEDRPVAINGEVVIRPMMYLALSYDHRMIDGKDAVQFLVTVKALLEDPARILLSV